MEDRIMIRRGKSKLKQRTQPPMRKQLTMPKRLPSNNKDNIFRDEESESEEVVSLDIDLEEMKMEQAKEAA